jgi:hypothetical protein
MDKDRERSHILGRLVQKILGLEKSPRGGKEKSCKEARKISLVNLQMVA